MQHADYRNWRLLRVGGKRPKNTRTGSSLDEIAASHACPETQDCTKQWLITSRPAMRWKSVEVPEADIHWRDRDINFVPAT
ncbi:MAG TPA: hypothetical protein VGJ04_02260 [Pirellulales bacterium]